MAYRKVKSVRVGSCAVEIHRDSDINEFRVRAIINGRVEGGRTGGGYFTDDKGDARGTAAVLLRHLRKRPACRAGR
jgi:hypothetical protein